MRCCLIHCVVSLLFLVRVESGAHCLPATQTPGSRSHSTWPASASLWLKGGLQPKMVQIHFFLRLYYESNLNRIEMMPPSPAGVKKTSELPGTGSAQLRRDCSISPPPREPITQAQRPAPWRSLRDTLARWPRPRAPGAPRGTSGQPACPAPSLGGSKKPTDHARSHHREGVHSAK